MLDEILKDGILVGDTYRVFIPIEDHDLMKSVEIDANGDYIVQGVMTSDNTDEEDDSITPEGMDCQYFLDKGWVKYEHSSDPKSFIGEPLEVKVGQFTHPTRHEVVKGIFVKARLFAQRELAQQAVRMIQDLQKSNTKRMMGWSIEGNVKERNRKTGKIVKSVLRNVVLTANPVNTCTWVELSKSFAKNHELTDETMDKSMDIATAQAIIPQSLEGATKDPQNDWVKLFRKFCRANFLNKALRNEFVASSQGAVGMTAYTYALANELDNEGAFEFASYISDKHEDLKAIFEKSLFGKKYGGENVGKIANLLDADLEELRKSLEMDEEDDDDVLEKSKGKDGSKEHEDSETDDEEEDEEESGDDEDDSEDDDSEDDDSEDDDDKKSMKKEKSIQTDFVKSLAENEDNAQAIEVSDFLFNLSEEIGVSMDSFAKSMGHVSKQQTAITKALMTAIEAINGLQAENVELKKSLEGVINLPIGRKGVVTTREATTLSKSLTPPGRLNRTQIGTILMKSFETGMIPATAVTRYEAGTPLANLNLPESVKAELGL